MKKKHYGSNANEKIKSLKKSEQLSDKDLIENLTDIILVHSA
jgi:hypothetical protein